MGNLYISLIVRMSELKKYFARDQRICVVFSRGRIQRKTWCMGPYARADFNLTLCRLLRHAHVTWATLCQIRPEPYVRVDFIPQSGNKNLASGRSKTGRGREGPDPELEFLNNLWGLGTE